MAEADTEIPPTDRTVERVDHPAHYTAHPSGVECVDVNEWLASNVGAALKYLWRSGLKATETELDDLKKARWYLMREQRRQRMGERNLSELAARVLDSSAEQRTSFRMLMTLIREDALEVHDFDLVVDLLNGEIAGLENEEGA